MFKVMAAINNDKDNLNYCNLISQDKRFDIIRTSTGIQTIDTYFERKPDALFLIGQMYNENHCPKLNVDDLYSYFLDFKIHLSSNGCRYLKSAIELCLYNYPFYGNTFDNLLLQLAYQYHKEPEQIRDSIKNALKPINTSSQKYVMQLYPEIFIDDAQLSPKKFIERSTIYFHRKLRNK